MKIEDRDKMNQVVGMLYAIETVSDEDGICSVAHDARVLLVKILDSDRQLMIKEDGKRWTYVFPPAPTAGRR